MCCYLCYGGSKVEELNSRRLSFYRVSAPGIQFRVLISPFQVYFYLAMNG